MLTSELGETGETRTGDGSSYSCVVVEANRSTDSGYRRAIIDQSDLEGVLRAVRRAYKSLRL